MRRTARRATRDVRGERTANDDLDEWDYAVVGQVVVAVHVETRRVVVELMVGR